MFNSVTTRCRPGDYVAIDPAFPGVGVALWEGFTPMKQTFGMLTSYVRVYDMKMLHFVVAVTMRGRSWAVVHMLGADSRMRYACDHELKVVVRRGK